MNSLPTLPPDRDLRPATRQRQRAELTAIVEHEAATNSHGRRLVPVAAAAAVVLIAGAAIAVPALRPDKEETQPPVGGSLATPSRGATPGSPVEPLSEAERIELEPKCAPELKPAGKPEIVDGFRYTNPPADAGPTQWVVKKAVGEWFACGFDQTGKRLTGTEASPAQPMYRPVEAWGMGIGLYTKSITRITVTPQGGEPVDAVLRDGFFYAPVPELKENLGGPASTPMAYVTRGYNARGKLVYTSPKTVGERNRKDDHCYTAPDGTLYRWVGKTRPDPKGCLRMIAWDLHPVPR